MGRQTVTRTDCAGSELIGPYTGVQGQFAVGRIGLDIVGESRDVVFQYHLAGIGVAGGVQIPIHLGFQIVECRRLIEALQISRFRGEFGSQPAGELHVLRGRHNQSKLHNRQQQNHQNRKQQQKFEHNHAPIFHRRSWDSTFHSHGVFAFISRRGAPPAGWSAPVSVDPVSVEQKQSPYHWLKIRFSASAQRLHRQSRPN